MKLGEKIGNLRRLQGFSQEQLAERLHISRQAVSKWEVGDALPDAANLLELARLLGCSVDYLLRDEWDADPLSFPPASAAPRRVSLPVGLGLAAAGLVVMLALASRYAWWDVFPVSLGLLFSIAGVVVFVLGRPTAAEKRLFFTAFAWMTALPPCLWLARGALRLWPRPYLNIVDEALGLALYLAVCVSVTLWLRRRKTAS